MVDMFNNPSSYNTLVLLLKSVEAKSYYMVQQTFNNYNM